MPIICKIIGHKPCEVAARHGYDICASCGKDLDMNDRTRPDWSLTYLRYRLQDFKWSVRRWLRPCCDCGRRFGRHDPKVDCLPF